MDIGVKGGELKTSFGAAERRVGADGQEEPSGHSAATKYLFQAVMPTAGRSPNLQFGLTNFICRIDLEGGNNTSSILLANAQQGRSLYLPTNFWKSFFNVLVSAVRNRLRNPGYEFGEICVYKLIVSHLRRPM